MDDSRFLIVGAYGQLGKALQAKYPNAKAVDRDDFDMTDQALIDAYDWSGVDVVLNAAAYTNVDGAEAEDGRPLAWKINATGVGYISRAAAQNGVTVVHISSDYVFDGTKTPHTETEDFAPLGVYGQTKAAGDIAVATSPKHYILRISWLIGDGPNFVRTMIGLAGKNISPKVVSDQVGRLTFTHTLVDAIDHLLSTKAEFGTYNVTNDGRPAGWAEITREIFKALGRDDLTVTDTTTEEYFASKPGIAPRPLKSELDLAKIKATGLELRDWTEELQEYVAAEQAATDKE
jgi:dTDP-4-dehydrorhamnose reductase